MLFEDLGGFDGLYLKMLASGIPTAVHLMWIPFSELNFREQFLLITRLSYRCLNGLWETTFVSYGREWVFEQIRNLNDDIMMMIIFPLVEFVIPYPVFYLIKTLHDMPINCHLENLLYYILFFKFSIKLMKYDASVLYFSCFILVLLV